MGTLSDCHDFSNMPETSLGTTFARSVRTLKCISLSPTDVYIPVPQVVLNLISYDEWDLIPRVTALRFSDLTDKEKRLPMKTEANKLLSTSVLFMPVVIRSLSHSSEGVQFVLSSFSNVYLYKPFILFFTLLAKFSFGYALAFLVPFLYSQVLSPIFFPGCTSMVPLPLQFHLVLQFNQEAPAMLVSWLSCLNSCKQGSRVLVLWEKCL